MGVPREIIGTVLNGFRPFGWIAWAALAAALGCHAQTPAEAAASQAVQVGVQLSPEMARRVEVLIRSKSSQVSIDDSIAFTVPAKSEIPGYDQVTATFTTAGSPPRTATFLLSADGKTLAQFNKLDMSQDPKEKVSAVGRPARGGPPNAPVLIVVFDDLECPFCAEMNSDLIPAILNRYKDQVRVVYRDFPLDQHLWAMHAAVDANCLAAGSTEGYWNFVDYVHAHAADIPVDQKTLDKANQALDKIAMDEGARQKVSQPDLVACVLKQDASKVKASVDQALIEPLDVASTPVLFINGEKVVGITSVETLDHVIDQALVAAGQTPPPPRPAPAQPAPAANKPGS
jgi:protein-disulfide isomerase